MAHIAPGSIGRSLAPSPAGTCPSRPRRRRPRREDPGPRERRSSAESRGKGPAAADRNGLNSGARSAPLSRGCDRDGRPRLHIPPTCTGGRSPAPPADPAAGAAHPALRQHRTVRGTGAARVPAARTAVAGTARPAAAATPPVPPPRGMPGPAAAAAAPARTHGTAGPRGRRRTQAGHEARLAPRGRDGRPRMPVRPRLRGVPGRRARIPLGVSRPAPPRAGPVREAAGAAAARRCGPGATAAPD